MAIAKLLKVTLVAEELVEFGTCVKHVEFTHEMTKAKDTLAKITETLSSTTKDLTPIRIDVLKAQREIVQATITELEIKLADSLTAYTKVRSNMLAVNRNSQGKEVGRNTETAVDFYLNMLAIANTGYYTAITSFITKDDTVMKTLAKLTSIADDKITSNGAFSTDDELAKTLRLELNKVSTQFRLNHQTAYTDKMNKALEFDAKEIATLQQLFVKDLKVEYKGKGDTKSYDKTSIVYATEKDVQKFIVKYLIGKFNSVGITKASADQNKESAKAKEKANEVEKSKILADKKKAEEKKAQKKANKTATEKTA